MERLLNYVTNKSLKTSMRGGFIDAMVLTGNHGGD